MSYTITVNIYHISIIVGIAKGEEPGEAHKHLQVADLPGILKHV